jgi:tyrosyl-tRNA synthetase
MNKEKTRSFLEDLQKRNIISNKANDENITNLKSEERIIYLGIDCTAESLHIGHLFLIMQTIRFVKEDFKVILVLGGATSKIGDPSDKLKERPFLEGEKIINYTSDIKKQLEDLLIKNTIDEINKEEIENLPLENFYSDNQELLDEIYNILEIKQSFSKKEK